MEYYENLVKRCRALGETDFIGKTVLGYDIPIVLGGGETLVVCSTHAREHITTEVLFGLFEKKGLPFDFVPVHNIDGVLLAKYGAEAIRDKKRRDYLLKINKKEDFSLWKANANAVDLNVNFDAKWGEGKKNVRTPAPENYIGRYPASEPETKAIVKLLRKKRYAQVVAYHAKGEVVYWGFGDNRAFFTEAELFARAMGYAITTAVGSCGGLKDYFDLTFPGLGMTVEMGSDDFSHPYPYAEIPNLLKRLEPSLEILYENGRKIRRILYERSDRTSARGEK